MFARDLRTVRDRADLSFDQMAAKVKCSNKTLCEATHGEALPSWRTTEDFLQACGVAEQVINDEWKPTWEAANRVSELLKAPARHHFTEPKEVTDALREVMGHRGIAVDDLITRAETLEVPDMGSDSGWYRPSPAALRAVLVTRSTPPDRAVLITVLLVCGAAIADIEPWLKNHSIKHLLHTTTSPDAIPVAHDSTLEQDAQPAQDTAAETVMRVAVPDTAPPQPPAQQQPAPVDDLSHHTLDLEWQATSSPVVSPPPRQRAAPALRSVPRYRQFAVVGCVITVVCAVAAVSPFTTAPGNRHVVAKRSIPSHPPTATPPEESVAATPAGRPARHALAQLAARIGQTRTPATGGPVTYVHTLVERPDDTSASVEPFTATDVQLWWRPHHTGRLITTPVPASGELRADQVASIRPVPPQSLDLPIEEPSTDPGILARQLAEGSPGIGTPLRTLQSVVQIYRYYCPDPPQRAAILRILADTMGLLTSDASDPSDPPELQVVATTAGNTVQQYASFDLGTGALLSAKTLHVPPKVDALSAPTMTEAMVFHSCDHRPTAD